MLCTSFWIRELFVVDVKDEGDEWHPYKEEKHLELKSRLHKSLKPCSK